MECGIKIEIRLKRNTTKKMRTVMLNGFEQKMYLKGTLYPEEVTEIMKIKLHMIEVNENYTKEERNCSQCKVAKESTEHVLMECKLRRSNQYLSLPTSSPFIRGSRVSNCIFFYSYNNIIVISSCL